jgi:hypothetical protein
MATRPDDNPGNAPAEAPVPPSEPSEPAAPPETEPSGPDFDQPDTGPAEMPQL